MIGSVFSIFGQLITVISLTSTLLIANTDLSLLLLISLIPFLRLSQEKPVMHFRKDRYPKTKKRIFEWNTDRARLCQRS